MAIPTRTLIQLASMGLSADQAEVVATMLRDVEEATKVEVGAPMEARRAADRKRKQEERERSSIASRHVTSADVTSLPVTSAPSAEKAKGEAQTVFSSEEVSPPSPPKGGSVPPSKTRRIKPVGTLCPEDLRPSESHYLKCDQRGVPRSIADRSAEIIIDWSHTHADRDIAWKTDWPRALHRILDGEIEKFQRDQGGPPRGRPPPGQRVSGLTALAHDKAAARQMERNREPTLDLEHRPFPTAQRDHSAYAGSGSSAPRRDEPWPDRDGSGTVHDFPARRAFGG